MSDERKRENEEEKLKDFFHNVIGIKSEAVLEVLAENSEICNLKARTLLMKENEKVDEISFLYKKGGLVKSYYEKNLSVFALHFPFFFHHSYFFLFTLSKSPDKTILLKVTVYPVLLQTRFSLIISYCLTNSNFTAWFKSSNQKYFSQTYPSQFLLLHKNSYKTSFLKSYSFAIDNITLYL